MVDKKPVKETKPKVVKEKKVIVKKEVLLEEYDASNLVMGRLGSYIAQRLQKGIKVNVYNAENTLITGDPKTIVSEFKERFEYRAKGNPRHGPKYPRLPHMILKKSIQRMLPTGIRGVTALKNLKIYIGNEDNKKLLTIEVAKIKQGSKYLELGELSKRLGANKW